MRNIEKYYDNTESCIPRNNVEYFIKEIKIEPKNAIELGCGAENDTIYLIKNNWNVIAIDREDVEERISKRLSKEELRKFTFQKQSFENLEIEKSDLIVANYSLPFCEKDKFEELWNKIKASITNEGYFIGIFFGLNDSWKETKTEMVLLSKEEIMELFRDLEIIRFKEIEKDALTGLGKMKHWHIFDVIAKSRFYSK